MKEFTFIVEAAVTISANSEEEARKILEEHQLDEDVLVGNLQVCIISQQGNTAKLVDVYSDDLDAKF